MTGDKVKATAREKVGFAVLVLAQCLLLAGIIFTRNSWLADGYKVVLRTAPVDPRSLFRGDYVSLTYDISSIDLTEVENPGDLSRGQYVYVGLREAQDGISQAVSVGHEPPSSGMPFIKGRARRISDTERKDLVVRGRDKVQRSFQRTPNTWMFEKEDIGRWYVLCLSKDMRQMRGGIKRELANITGGECSADEVAYPAVLEDLEESSYSQLWLDYTADTYFVEEGKGKEIEKKRNLGQVLVELSLREDGMPLISALIIDGQRLE